MSTNRIAFVGGGNMARAIVGGLLSSGVRADSIRIAEPDALQHDKLADMLPGVVVSSSNSDVAAHADYVVLAVKPQIVASVCAEIRDTVAATKPVIVSIAAGVRSDDINDWLGGGFAVIRVMPNQPALLRSGVSGIFANARTKKVQLATACGIMEAVGSVVRVSSEDDIDTVTAISGSGPAYFFLLIDMLTETAENFGLESGVARKLAVDTARGAAELATRSDEAMDVMIARVRSPGGTTAAALDVLEKEDIRAIFLRALTAARERAGELADAAGALKS